MIADLQPYPEYKPTGIDWLDRLPKHWRELSLKRIARSENSGCYGDDPENGKIVLPVATTAQIDRDGNFAVARMSQRGFTESEKARYCCKAGDVLVVKSSGSAANVISGKAGIVRATTPPFVFSNFLMRFVARQEQVEPEFLFLLLTSNLTRERVKRMVSTTTYPNLRVGEYCSALLPLPPPEEQAAMVRFLDYANGRLERAIRAKRKVIALLHEQKQAIIHCAVTRGLDPTVPLKPSGIPWLGDIPKHWEVLRSKYLYREVDERSATGKETHLSMSQKFGLVPSSQIEEKRLVSESYAGAKLCEVDDLVLNRLKAHLGVFALAPQRGLVSSDYTVLRPARKLEARYFEAVYRTPACRVELRRRAKGIVEGFWRLYTDDFYDIRLPVPPVDEQKRIMTQLDIDLSGMNTASARLEREIELLQEYRRRLVADVVTGQLDVRPAARNLPAEPVEPGLSPKVEELPETELEEAEV